MRWRALALVIPVLLVSMAATAMGKEIKRNYHESFEVAQGDRLHLVHGDGNVTIEPWDRDVLDIEVRYRAEVTKIGLGSEPDFSVEFDQDRHTVHVIGKEKSTVTLGFRSKTVHEYLYTIRAPAHLELDLKGDDGDVSITGWQGIISCRLDDGDLELCSIRSPETEIYLEDGDLSINELSGKLLVESDDGEVELANVRSERCQITVEDGDILIKDSEGDFDLESEDGNIDVRRSLARNLEIRSEDGDVELDLLETDDLDLDVTTSDGDVTIELAAGTSVAFDIDTDDGGIRLNLPDDAIVDRDHDRATGKLHGGQGRIRVDTEDGTVRLRENR